MSSNVIPRQRTRRFDVAVCGLSTVDMIVHPVDWNRGFGDEILREIEPIMLTTGGIVANSGLALAKLGQQVAAMTAVGRDPWGQLVVQKLQSAGVDVTHVDRRSGQATSTTVVLVDRVGERRFLHCPGAPQQIDADFFLERLSVFQSSTYALFGYYSLFPKLEPHLPAVFQAIRQRGCKVVLDAAGSGGDLEPLRSILPEVDIYFPSYEEARHQTRCDDVEEQIRQFMQCGIRGLVGIKLGSKGVALHDGEHIMHIPSFTPPRAVRDTTGAGDCFLAGFLTGLLQGFSPEKSAKLGTMVAAHAITEHGAEEGIPPLETLLSLLTQD